jgi:Mg-chelatase subunit ChlD
VTGRHDRGGSGSAPSVTDGQTWAVGGAVFVLAGVGTFLTQYLSGAYESPDRTAGLVAGSVLVGLASALPVVLLPLVPLVRGLLVTIATGWRWVLAVAGAASVVTAAILGLGPQVSRLTNEWWGCAPAGEFTVVTTPAVRNTADELLTAFEASTARANDGCPTAHGFVYDAPEQTITDAVADGWVTAADGTSFPRRDIGPRPDIWLTESTLPINVLYRDNPSPPIADVHSFGQSPVVLAVPALAPRPTDGTLPELVDSASALLGVVRPDPIRSTVGLLATAALYGAPVDDPPSRVDPAVAGDLAVEQELGAAGSARAFPDGDEGALLCRFRALPGSRPALILSEQAVRRYNAGQPVGSPCPGGTSAPGTLTPLYTATPALDHQVVRLGWPEGPRSPRVADDFADWLTSPDGRTAVEATRLRPTKAGDKASSNLAERGDVDPGAVAAVRLRYLAAHRPRRELLALDLSGSMERPSRLPGLTRADEVREAVVDSACVVRSNDEIGLWTFPDESDRRPQQVVPLAQRGCSAVRAAVGPLQPRGDTPLLQTLLDGVTALRATDEAAERRLVVVTDGEDTSSGATRADVLAALTDAQVKVYVVTLGDVTCDADPLQDVADATGGRCYDPGSTVDQIRDALEG